MKVILTDGGRAKAGHKGTAGDCVCRAISIASGRPYGEIYDRLASGNHTQRQTAKAHKSSGVRTADKGIQTNRKWFKDYMVELGATWVSTMGIGTGCKVHMRPGELPDGRLVVALSKHMTAVIDGVIHDTHDPSRDGTRCVYGYWVFP